MSTDLLDLVLVSTLVLGNLGLTVTVLTLSSLLRTARRRIDRQERAIRNAALAAKAGGLITFPDDMTPADYARFATSWRAQYGPAHRRDLDETVQFDAGRVRR